MASLLWFFIGVFATNGVPHFVKGITGERFYTLFARDTSAVGNVLWGMANFLFAALLWRCIFGGRPPLSGAAWCALLLGGALTALGLAHYFSHPELRLPWQRD